MSPTANRTANRTTNRTTSGVEVLTALALRRSRILIPAWLLAFVATAASSASATVGLYPTQASRVEAATAFNAAPPLVALYGRVYDTASTGALAMVKLGSLGAVLVAVLSIVLVVRHTRAEEEAGRHELLGATAIGRLAPLTAGLAVAMGASCALGLLTSAGLVAAGLPVDGSIAFGLAWASVGLAFAAIAAVAAQLVPAARSATGLAVAVLGAVYLLRAVGDAAGGLGWGWLTWLSPIGWSQQFRPYAGNRWWVASVVVAFTVVTTGAALALRSRRDLGTGLIPDRAGPGTAADALRSPLALAWRLHCPALLGWATGTVVLGLVFGALATNLSGFLDSAAAREVFEQLGGRTGLTDAYLATMLGVLAVIASVYGVQAAGRVRTEEAAGRLDPLLAAGSSRARWLLGHTVIALGGTVGVLVLSGLAAGLAYGTGLDGTGLDGTGLDGTGLDGTGLDGTGLPDRVHAAARIVGGALAQAPAACVVTALAVAACALSPRLAAAGWVALAGFVLIGELGPVLGFDRAVMDVSPFIHSPRLPGAALDGAAVLALAGLLTVTGALVALAVTSFRRRDLRSA